MDYYSDKGGGETTRRTDEREPPASAYRKGGRGAIVPAGAAPVTVHMRGGWSLGGDLHRYVYGVPHVSSTNNHKP